jgi:hypothetical protein
VTKSEKVTLPEAALTPEPPLPWRGPGREDAHRDPLLTIVEAAALCRVPIATMRWWRAKRIGPQFGTIGRRVLIRESILTSWIDDQMNAVPRTTDAGIVDIDGDRTLAA